MPDPRLLDDPTDDRIAFVPRDTPIDLTNCDREPIHIPGAIQPHGAVLVLGEPDLTILQVSANVGERLGIPAEQLLGTAFADHVGADQAAAVLEPLRRGETRAYNPIALTLPGGAGGAPRHFDGVVHRSGRVVVVELEPATGESLSYYDFHELVRGVMTRIEEAESLAGLAGTIAEQMRELTGFDRVWVYKFHEDWHGEIIGEAKRDDIETWLGMHYPASDIPAQARALFLRHWLRMIADIDYAPVPMVPRDEPRSGAPLDMGGTVLRAVSPIHVEYLQNMGVRASLVISLVKGGRLWGLISGHHYAGPKFVPYATRTLCEFLAQAFSTQLGMTERVEHREQALGARALQARLLERLGRAPTFADALVGEPRLLLDLVRAGGAALAFGGDLVTVGETPPPALVRELLRWLGTQPGPVVATSALPAHFPPARAAQAVASGVLAARLSTQRPDWLLWFRPESRQTVRWAGDPRKPVLMTEDGVARLQPRGSFELWEETVRGTSAAWLPAEVEAASELRGVLIDLLLRRADEIAALNAELEALNDQLTENATELELQTEELRVQQESLLEEREAREAALVRERAARGEAETANRAKSEFLAMMSHELRTPLNAIAGYAQLMELGLRGPTTAEQRVDLGRIQNSQRHLLGLINSILNYARLEAGQVQFAVADATLDAMVRDAHDLVEPQLRAKGLRSRWASCEPPDGDGPVLVRADAEKVRQILLNLLSNAIKFTPAGGEVEVACEVDAAHAVVRVRDTGRGIPADRLEHIFEPFVQVDRHLSAPHADAGVGLGLAISRDLAVRMGGGLSAESAVGGGSTFTLTLPLAG